MPVRKPLMPARRDNWAYNDLHHALKRKAKRLGLVCTWCGQPFDWSLPWRDPMAFTYGHDEDISDGGALRGTGHPLHRRCNSQEWHARHGGKIRPRPQITPPCDTREW